MEICFQAFKWECQCESLPLNEFLQYEKNLNGAINNNRILYFVDDNHIWKGVVLTVKDMKKFTTLVDSGGSLSLDVHTLRNNEKLSDFNFFILDELSGYGLYQYYHNSCSLTTFNSINRSRYLEKKQILKNEENEKLSKRKISQKQISKILKKYNSSFIASIIEREGSFIDRVSSMKNIYDAEFQINVDSINDGFLAPILINSTSIRYKISFSRKTNNSISEQLAAFFNRFQMNRARVNGIDEYGNEIIYKLFNDFDKFATFDYDDFVAELNLDKTKLTESIKNNLIIHELASTYIKIKEGLK